jgi:hypothetical protein
MAPKKAKSVTIPEEDYEEFLRESELLTALIQVGVEDWEGYETALELVESGKLEGEDEDEDEDEDDEDREDEDEPGSELL